MAVFGRIGGQAGDGRPSGAVAQRVFDRLLFHNGLLVGAWPNARRSVTVAAVGRASGVADGAAPEVLRGEHRVGHAAEQGVQ